MISFKMKSNVEEVKRAEEEAKEKALYAVGLKWQEIATKVITRNKIVDTGRLKGSLTFITAKQVGKPTKATKHNKTTDFLTGSAPEGELIVGSNVEYARRQEFENPKGSYLRASITGYQSAYKKIALAVLKGEL